MVAMLAPAPFASFEARDGSLYIADSAGVIANVVIADLGDMQNMGCMPLGLAGQGMIARLLGANMNSTLDQAFTMFVPPTIPFRVTKITARNASVSLTTAAGGVYTAASKGGTNMVTSTQVYSALTASNISVDLTILAASAAAVLAPGTTLYLELGTAQGAAATADFYVFGDSYA
jgi:hypothetical protein